MQKKTINSQYKNFKVYLMYLRQCRSLAENVFLFEDLPEYVDVAYINKTLVEKGSIAWFKDEVMGLLALPWVRQGNLDVYGRPTTIRVYGTNGYTKELKVGEYVIMYDRLNQDSSVFTMIAHIKIDVLKELIKTIKSIKN